MPKQIGVIGAGVSEQRAYNLAFEVGKAIAEAGAVVVCGGMGGIMEAVCQGARSANGKSIGILPGNQRGGGNRFVDYEIVTGFGQGRNVLVCNSADALIAISGAHGTLSEIAIGLKLGKPVIGLNTWDIDGVIKADSPQKAVEKALELID